ncbi:tetratricopeptide repeat protein [Longispora urticae]
MMMRGAKNWWRKGLFAVVALGGLTSLGRFLAGEHLDRADKWMSVISGFVTLGGLIGVAYRSPAVSGSEPQSRPDLTRFLLHVSGERPPAVSDIDLGALGVKPSIGSDVDGPTGYVARDGETDLEWAIAEGGIVLLHGVAAAGKTRTAAQVLRRLRPDDDLLVPAGLGSLRALLDAGHAVRNAVVWLDDLERYLGDDGVDLALLQRLSPVGRRDVAVVATIRNEELAFLDAAATVTRTERQQAGIHRPGVELLQHITGRRRIAITSHLTDTELAVAASMQAAAGDDTRVADAAASTVGFGEYLVAGPAMLRRWAVGEGALHDLGQALISAAIDCRRAGYNLPIPAATLAELAAGYLSKGRQHRSDLPGIGEALAWASQPVLGASSCLTPNYDAYAAADFLVDRADTYPSPLAGKGVAPKAWLAVLPLADPDTAYSVGIRAHNAAQTTVAEMAWRQAANANHTGANYNLGAMLFERGELAEAEEFYRRAATDRNVEAMNNLGAMLFERGELAEAEEFYRRALDDGGTKPMYNLGVLLEGRNELGEAEALYRRAAEMGHANSMHNLAVVLEGRGEAVEAEEFYRQAAAGGTPASIHNLGLLLVERGEVAEAEKLYRRAAGAGDIGSIYNLAILCERRGEVAEAEKLYRRAAGAGDIHSMNNLAVLLAERGEPDEAESFYRQGLASGDVSVLSNLGVLLVERGELAEAEECFRWGASTGNNDAIFNLGVLLAELGQAAEGEECHRRAADGGHTGAMCYVAVYLVGRGEVDEAVEILRRAADAGDAQAAHNLAVVLGHSDPSTLSVRREGPDSSR